MLRLIERLITAIAPPHNRDWTEAMVAEAYDLRGRERLNWYVDAVWVAMALRIRAWGGLLQAGSIAFLLLVVDWTSGALIPALALIALSAAILTRSSTHHGRRALLVAAGTLPAAHAIANWVPALRPHYQFAPLDLRDWAILAAVAVIGICMVRVADASWRAWDLAR